MFSTAVAERGSHDYLLGGVVREIKFRAWDGENKKMCHKVCVGYAGWHGEYWDDVTIVAAFNDENHKDNALMQFTGLKDKNGKEIWEGDILSIDGGGDIERLKVLWSDKDAAWFVEWPDGKAYELRAYVGMTFCEVEVLGNIYENPELLTSSEERRR